MANKYKKCLIILYFGKLNNYFNLWLNSCKYNTTYDFFFYTDDHSTFDYPNNVKVKYCSFEDIRTKIQSLFDFKIILDRPYKLSDYKPTYGELLGNEISNYDYWGYCDIDVIFGNLDLFYPDSELEKYDKVSEFGHFTLFKNTHILRSIYKEKIEGMLYYKEVFSSNHVFHFDEWGFGKGINEMLKIKGFKVQTRPFYFADIIVNAYGLRTIREKWDLWPQIQSELRKKKIFYRFNKGTLTQYSLIDNEIYKQEEMYIHLQKRPMKNKSTTVNSFIIVPPNIIKNIDPSKIITKRFFISVREKPSIIFLPIRKSKTLLNIIITRLFN